MTATSNPEEVLSPSGERFLTVRGAARAMGLGENKVRRMVADGSLTVTRDPELLSLREGRGRKPEVLIAEESVRELAPPARFRNHERKDQASAAKELEVCLEHQADLRAEVEKLKEVIRLGLIEADKRDEAGALLRQQLMQFVLPDFPDRAK